MAGGGPRFERKFGMRQAVVYYSFCDKTEREAGEYRERQRRIADEMLRHGFSQQFGLAFCRDRIKKGEYGKPYWDGPEKVFFNVSNTNGLVACAVGDTELGIDVEKTKEMWISAVRRCCTPQEREYIGEERERFFQIWTLKESYVKMIGEGLRFPLQEISFCVKGKPPMLRPWEISGSRPGFFTQRKMGSYWISVCSREEMQIAWQECDFPRSF